MRLCTFLVLLVVFAGCRATESDGHATVEGRPIKVVATTSVVADLVRQVGGEDVRVTGLMGPGVDPHLYRATEGDVSRMSGADVIFYNGLHLEGRMDELFEQMHAAGRRTAAVSDGVDASKLIASEQFASSYDPHIWNDPALWGEAAREVAETLGEIDPARAAAFEQRATAYARSLDSLAAWVNGQVAEIPADVRVLVTAHDAFAYLGRAFGIDVHGLQGLSTVAEAGTADVQALASFIAQRRIPALFVESSVSPRSIEAVQEAVRAQGFNVQIGGELYSDALGAPGSGADTYAGMMRSNIRTIVAALAP